MTSANLLMTNEKLSDAIPAHDYVMRPPPLPPSAITAQHFRSIDIDENLFVPDGISETAV